MAGKYGKKGGSARKRPMPRNTSGGAAPGRRSTPGEGTRARGKTTRRRTS